MSKFNRREFLESIAGGALLGVSLPLKPMLDAFASPEIKDKIERSKMDFEDVELIFTDISIDFNNGDEIMPPSHRIHMSGELIIGR